jgi:hypothetical protein
LNEEHLGSSQVEEEKTKEPQQEESEALGTVPTVEVSTITPLVVLAALSNHSSYIYQSTRRTVTNSLVHTQSRNLGRYMANEMRLPIFRGDGSEDPY